MQRRLSLTISLLQDTPSSPQLCISKFDEECTTDLQKLKINIASTLLLAKLTRNRLDARYLQRNKLKRFSKCWKSELRNTNRFNCEFLFKQLSFRTFMKQTIEILFPLRNLITYGSPMVHRDYI